MGIKAQMNGSLLLYVLMSEGGRQFYGEGFREGLRDIKVVFVFWFFAKSYCSIQQLFL